MSNQNNGLPKDPMKLLEIKQAEILSKNPFTLEPEFRKRLAFIQTNARHLSILELSGDLENYKRLRAMSTTEEMNMLDASTFLNAASRLSPEDLKMTDEEYVQFIERTDEVVIHWNVLATPLNTEAMKEVEKEMSQPKIQVVKGTHLIGNKSKFNHNKIKK